MKNTYDRRKFIQTTATGIAGFSLMSSFSYNNVRAGKGKKIGIIGLDTSHSIAFAKEFNAEEPDPALKGYKVVAAYPHGSSEIESSYSRIPKYTEQIQEFGVKIVDSIDELLKMCDVVLLETNDGRLHLEQSIPVLKAGKTVFIDKPMTASLADAIAIFALAKKYNVPVFTSSSLRYTENAQLAVQGKAGKIVGATTFGPSKIEKTHPDLFWYGIHAVELLYTVMGTGCKTVTRVHTDITDVAVGTWDGGKVGTFRGMRAGKYEFGGTAFGEEGNISLAGYSGYKPLLLEVAKFFETGQSPVSEQETIELFAFMEAADESKRRGGIPASLEDVMAAAREKADKIIKKS